MLCKQCGDAIHPKRSKLGYTLCLECGEEVARQKIFTVVPMHKSNYVACFNRDDLKGINNKGGLIK
jgi:ribosomal protein L37AE/L43A